MLNCRHFLHVPGPTNIPERVIRAMTSTMEDQRGANFPKFTKPLYEDMKKIFKTKDGTVIIWPSSGTGSWEACLLNTLSPGDKVLSKLASQAPVPLDGHIITVPSFVLKIFFISS